jgi:hypothetical protein
MSDTPDGGSGSGRPPAGRDPRKAPAKKASASKGSERAPTPSGADTDEHQGAFGAVLVGIAVVIGLVLLVRGFSDEGGLVAGEVAATTTTLVADEVDRNAPPTIDPAATSTTVAAEAPSEISIVVANGAGITGLAGEVADTLTAAGFVVVDTSNASSVSASVVYFAEGAQGDADSVATALGLDPAAAVAPMSDPAPVADLAGATVVVVAGPDLSGGASATATTTAG